MAFNFLRTSAEWNQSQLRQVWLQLIADSGNLHRFFQSPLWFDHLNACDQNANLVLGIICANESVPVGIVPMQYGIYTLKFDIAARSYWNIQLKTIYLLGSQLLIPEVTGYYDEVFRNLKKLDGDWNCIYLDSIPVQSFFWDYLMKSDFIRDNYCIHVQDNVRPFYYINLPRTFDEYLSSIKHTYRSEFKRRLKLIKADLEEGVDLIRIESEDQVDWFLANATVIAKNSWQTKYLGKRIDYCQERVIKLKDLARRQCLRGYILMKGKNPMSFSLGYQYQDAYIGAEQAYDSSLSRYAPGIVMFYLMIQDLINYKPVKIFNFGIGDAYYKKKLCNVQICDASILLFKKTLKNRLISTNHSIFRYTVRNVRDMLKSLDRVRLLMPTLSIRSFLISLHMSFNPFCL